MAKYSLSFAGSTLSIRHDDSGEEIPAFLNLLFADLQTLPAGDFPQPALDLEIYREQGHYALRGDNRIVFKGELGVQCAAVLFDLVIFNLLKDKNNGVALHAAAVTFKGKTIILPGQSGSGKSNTAAWLTAHGFSYLTDELVFLPRQEPARTIPFTRPVCIKAAAVTAVKKLLSPQQIQTLQEDRYGTIIPHRMLNPDFSPQTAPPALILFPMYQPSTSLNIEQISGARACTLLMASDVNGRNLKDHGFKQMSTLAATTPACRMVYSDLAELADKVPQLLSRMGPA